MALEKSFDKNTARTPPAPSAAPKKRFFSEREDAERRAAIRGTEVQNPFVREGNEALIETLRSSVQQWEPEYLSIFKPEVQDAFFATEVRVEPDRFDEPLAQAYYNYPDRSISLRSEESRGGTSLLTHEGIHRVDITPLGGTHYSSQQFVEDVREEARQNPAFRDILKNAPIGLYDWIIEDRPQPRGYAGEPRELYAYLPVMLGLNPTFIPDRLKPYYEDIFDFEQAAALLESPRR